MKFIFSIIFFILTLFSLIAFICVLMNKFPNLTAKKRERILLVIIIIFIVSSIITAILMPK